MDKWMTAARDRLAGAVGDDAASYDLSEDDVRVLLDLARVSAHESGDRTNAPLACYLVGLALGRHPESTLSDIAGRTSSSTD
jgi:hypothetical protein